MKTKIVMWGINEKDEKLLLGIELLERENKIGIHTFSEKDSTEEFYNKMMNIWRDGGEVPFPEGHKFIIRDLKMAENLLPDDISTDRTDIINRAKTEWHFVILSNKLSESLKEEIEDIGDRISKLTEYDPAIWEEMKTFWSKVQVQLRDKNLFREHANDLKDMTNNLFEKMKDLKKSMDNEFDHVSQGLLGSFIAKLDEIEEKINKGLGLQPIFNELKGLQIQFRDTNFNRKDRNKAWKKLDSAFKKVKEKKYGDNQGDTSSLTRVNRRYDGLLAAINKMQTSINRDKKEIEFQQDRIDSTDGQLEAQLRQAKLAMIDERIKSKDEKLQEMLRTKEELESKIQMEAKKELKRQEHDEIKREKEGVKAQIAAQIKESQSDLVENSERLAKAAAAIKGMSSAKSALPPHTEESEEIKRSVSNVSDNTVKIKKAAKSEEE